MKIGIDCRLWEETGIGRYVRNLVCNLQKIDKKNDYILYVLSKDCENIKLKIKNQNFKTKTADIRWHTFEEQIKFPQILNNDNLDLMHFPYFSVPILYNRPFVITVHDLIIDHFSTGRSSALSASFYGIKLLGYKFVLGQAVKKARKIIAVSNATKSEIVEHLKISPQKISVIYEGIDEKILNLKSRVFPAGEISNQNLRNQIYFLYVGNAYPHKNLNRLIKAFGMANLDAELVLVGKKDYFYERLEKKVSVLGLSEKVVIKQNISDGELSGLYQNALALVIPSLMEGFGLTSLEAMANNCLVLASDIPSLKEVCGDAALYFNPYNIDEILEKMKNVLNHSNDTYYYSENRKRNLERVKLFSWEKAAKQTLRIYENSIGSQY